MSLTTAKQKKARETIAEMIKNGATEMAMKNSPLTVVKDGFTREGDLPIAQIDGYIIVQRGL